MTPSATAPPRTRSEDAGRLTPRTPLRTRAEFFFVRACERLLPPPLLRIALWPLMAMQTVPQFLVYRRHHWDSPKLPAALRRRGGYARQAWQRCLQRRYALVPTIFADRLDAPRWRHRLRCEGLEYLSAAHEAGHPVILATLHFACPSMLRCVLAVEGIPVTFMAFGSPDMVASVQLKDHYIARLAGCRHVPSLLLTKDLRKVADVLASRCVLALCVDTGTGKDVTGHADGAKLRMASGAIRLARSQNARLIPALIYEEKPWHYVVRIDPPVPWEDMPDDKSVADALARAFLPVIAPRVEQYECGPLVFWNAAPAPAKHTDRDDQTAEACAAHRPA